MSHVAPGSPEHGRLSLPRIFVVVPPTGENARAFKKRATAERWARAIDEQSPDGRCRVIPTELEE